MDPLVSVVIPTYNREEILSRAIDSVMTQIFQNWELLIVDDGSTDGTKKLVKNYRKKDDRIKYLERPDSRKKGANACRNIGIEKANGKYIALLDSDDEWKPKHLEDCYNFAESKKKFYGSYTSAIVQKGPFKIRQKSREKRENESYFDFELSAIAYTPSFFLNSEAARKIKFDEVLQRHQDYDFFIRFGEKFGWFFNPSMEVIVHYNLVTNLSEINFKSCIEFYEANKDNILIKANELKYLQNMYEKAYMMKDKKAKNYYRRKLAEQPGKEKLVNDSLMKFRIAVDKNYFLAFIKCFLKYIGYSYF